MYPYFFEKIKIFANYFDDFPNGAIYEMKTICSHLEGEKYENKQIEN